MFTEITQQRYQSKSEREYIWNAEEGADCLLAGAILGGEVIRVRCIRGIQLEKSRCQLPDDGAGATLPYHSEIVAKGDEQWPDYFSEAEARVILEPYLQGFAVSPTAMRLVRPLASQERIYGLGERTGNMNKRGQAFPIWNIDPQKGHNPQTETMYTSIPFYLGLTLNDGRAYGILIDHTGRVEVDMGKTTEAQASMTVEGDSLVVYFFSGPTAADVMRQYSELTGHMPLPPRWATGYHQCRWGYTSEQAVRQVAAQLRERSHPCDAIWLDIDYMHDYRNFTWDPDRFP